MSSDILRLRQRLTRLALHFGAAAALLAISGCVHERPRFNQIQFAVQTGSSALDSSSAATAKLRSKHGRVRQRVTLKAANQPSWKTGTTRTATFRLKHRSDACDIGKIDITLQPPGGPVSTSWTLQKVTATLSIDKVNQTVLASEAGNPLANLTTQNPTLHTDVPCIQRTSLYDRLGRKPGIEPVVEAFMQNVEQDNRVNRFFVPVFTNHRRREEFKERMVSKMCELGGGPCRGGKFPLTAVGSGVTEFRAVMDDLVAAMAKFPATVSITDKNELMAAKVLSEIGAQPAVRKIGAAAAPTGPTTIGVVGNPIVSPIFMNLYWDALWDAHNTAVPMEAFDSFTKAVIGSSYFAGLSEYGISRPNFGGSLLPSPKCPQAPGSTVGFYDPFNPSIIGFLQCELDQGLVQEDDIIYNIILPQGSTESDSLANFLGLAGPLCTGSGSVIPTAWHFHGSPYSTGAQLGGLLGWFIGGFVGDPVQGAVVGFFLDLSQQGGPFYTISSASTAPLDCGNLPHNVLHEMVEAASDPSPPLSVLMHPATSEIVDICDNMGVVVAPPSRSWVPTSSLPTGVTLTPGGFLASQVPQYWSNAGQKCTPGFSDTTVPDVTNVTVSGTFPSTTVTITGSGFGSVPFLFPIPTSANLPYSGIQDQKATPTWQAGNSLNFTPSNPNLAGFTVMSWADNSISINGFSAPNSSIAMQAGDSLTVWVCNPSSGVCGPGTGSSSAGGSCGANNMCCPAGHAACGGTCCTNPSDICDPTTNSCTLACPGGGCAAGQVCCEVSTTAGTIQPQCVTPLGPTWCGNPLDGVYCDYRCPPGQKCAPICEKHLCTVNLYCQ